jgi:hypothetical protein
LDGVDADAQKTQLELYLDEPKYLDKNMTFYILSFWKGNESRYPEVSAMACDILSIPISTIASESTFSIGRHVIDQYRSSLKPDIIEALVCTRDWFMESKVILVFCIFNFFIYLYFFFILL